VQLPFCRAPLSPGRGAVSLTVPLLTVLDSEAASPLTKSRKALLTLGLSKLWQPSAHRAMPVSSLGSLTKKSEGESEDGKQKLEENPLSVGRGHMIQQVDHQEYLFTS